MSPETQGPEKRGDRISKKLILPCSCNTSTMASAKKKTSEEKKKSKETKPTKPEKKNNTKTKPKTNTNKKTSWKKQKNTNKISNGSMSEAEPEVEVVPTSSTDSKQEELEEDKKTREATNQRSNSKSKKPKRSGKKQELDDGEDDRDDAKGSIFPMMRMKRIMKSQGVDSLITGEAVFLVNKATEKFLQQFCEDAYAASVKDRKKSVSYKHLASVVSKQRRYDFLSDFVPEQIKAEDALSERKLYETGEG